MTISLRDWLRFTENLSRISNRAALELRRWVNAQGGYENIERQTLIDFVHALATKYGEGTSALAASWYDAIAEASGRFAAAEPAATATYAEAARTVNGVLKQSQNEEMLAGAMERLVKMPGADTDVFLEMLGFDQADIRRIKAQEQRARGLQLITELEA